MSINGKRSFERKLVSFFSSIDWTFLEGYNQKRRQWLFIFITILNKLYSVKHTHKKIMIARISKNMVFNAPPRVTDILALMNAFGLCFFFFVVVFRGVSCMYIHAR